MRRNVCLLIGLLALLVWQQAAAIDLNSYATPHVLGEMIIRFEDGTSRDEMKAYIEDSDGVVLRFLESSPSVHARFAGSDEQLFVGIREHLAGPHVVSMMPNFKIELLATPNDSLFSRQYQYGLIQSEAAWDINKGSKSVKVAVIDTGVNYLHRDLAPNYFQNSGETGIDASGLDKQTNGIDDDHNGYIDDHRGWDFGDKDNDPMDNHGHGTHCIGSIGARGNNGYGVTGVNWEVTIVGLKMSSVDGKGGGSMAAAIEAIEYATKMGFDIISASWGGSMEEESAEDPLRAAIEAAGKKGILFVAAAGNAGDSNDESKAVYPASYKLSNVIAVAASTASDRLAEFSNYGGHSVHIMAPGDEIYSTANDQWGSQYAVMSGTSMAAPIVAGAAALLKAEKPFLSASALKKTLMDTVDPIPSLEAKIISGGRLNIYRALID